MFKNLSPDDLGVVAMRQSELIEAALSFGFQGLSLDLSDFELQQKHGSLDHTRKLLGSARLEIGLFDLPIDWSGSDAEFAVEKGRLMRLAAAAAELGAKRCRVILPAGTDERPFHEQFEFTRKRMTETAKVLAPHEIQLGLGFDARVSAREGLAYQFIDTPDKLLTLIETIGEPNVGAVIDVWHWHIAGGDFDAVKKLAPERVVAVELSDSGAAAGDNQLEETDRCLVGQEGNINAAALIQALQEIGYAGPVTPRAHVETLAGLKRDEVLKKASFALRRLWVEAGLSDETLEEETTGAEDSLDAEAMAAADK